MKTVVIIGGGASGLMAALTAAQDRNNRVLLLERQQRLGRKLLSTGNGRCNLTNTGASPANYHGSDPAFPGYALSRFTPSDTLAFFRELGLLTVEEYGGRVYPLSNSANSVLDVLRFAAGRAGVEIHTACCAQSVKRRGRGFSIQCDAGRFEADALIVACGGMAGARLGGVKDGYELLRQLGHSRTKLCGALLPLITAPDYPRALKGVRADAAVFRGRDRRELRALLDSRRETLPELEAGELLTGMLHNRLGRMCVKYAGIGGAERVGELTDAQLERVLDAACGFTLPLRGTAGFDAAQVTVGGVSTAEFDPLTLQSRLVPGLFACGEVLDVDGDCGGYNLQWAWASGALAGRLGT